ncbi:MAG: hypothetical protein F6K26_12580 [Moorea sp. SIO2I5]|nr:hypothetical protein [Moorena sp. SIO2I5]
MDTSNFLDNQPDDQQVTAVISHFVRKGREQGYEEWLKGISADARKFEGHCGLTILTPQPGTRSEYVIILRFDSYHHLQRVTKSILSICATRTLRKIFQYEMHPSKFPFFFTTIRCTLLLPVPYSLFPLL